MTQTQPTILLVAAIDREIAPTLTRLRLRPTGRSRYAGSVGDAQVLAVVTGMGGGRVRAVVVPLLQQHRPDLIVLLGFAGGLAPGLDVGTIRPITWVINEHSQVFQLGQPDNPVVPQRPDGGQERDADRSLLTLDTVAGSPASKQQRFQRHRCAAVDMETFHVADLAAQHRVPLAVLRAIYDPDQMSLPPQSSNWVTLDGRARIAPAVWYLLTHPWALPSLLRLQRNCNLAGQRLADQAERVVRGRASRRG